MERIVKNMFMSLTDMLRRIYIFGPPPGVKWYFVVLVVVVLMQLIKWWSRYLFWWDFARYRQNDRPMLVCNFSLKDSFIFAFYEKWMKIVKSVFSKKKIITMWYYSFVFLSKSNSDNFQINELNKGHICLGEDNCSEVKYVFVKAWTLFH